MSEVNLKGRKVTVHDMTLRDGMHPKRHQIPLESMLQIAGALDEAAKGAEKKPAKKAEKAPAKPARTATPKPAAKGDPVQLTNPAAPAEPPTLSASALNRCAAREGGVFVFGLGFWPASAFDKLRLSGRNLWL